MGSIPRYIQREIALESDRLDFTEYSLAECEAERKALAEGIPAIIIRFDTALRARWVNSWTGRKYPRALGQSCSEIFCQKSEECGNCAVRRCLQSGVVESTTRMVENRAKKQRVVYDLVASPVTAENQRITGVIVMAYDMTEKHELQQRLRHAQKIEAIGAIAGGVAHDFNNVLTPIMGYSEIIRLRLKQSNYEDESILDYIDEILKAAGRAKYLAEQILGFARGTEKAAVVQYLHPIVKEVVKLMRVTLPGTTVIRQEIFEDCGRVAVDPVQMYQVLMNLCVNGSRSIGDGHGELLIRLAPTQYKKDGRKWIELSVWDNGLGGRKMVLAKDGDCSLSSDDYDAGSEMRLSVVKDIIDSMGGETEIHDELGKGTVFSIYLPVQDEKGSIEDNLALKELKGGSGTILLVDDEPQVVKVTGEILRGLGYSVVGRTSAPAALELFEATPEIYDLVMTDLVMPGLTGIELSTQLRRIRDDVNIILLTGYSDKVNRDEALEAGIDEFCTKPISMRELSSVVARFLAGDTVTRK